ncbi:amidohydrolase [Arachnia propionica]|uniref:Amidohydrolase n=1 Tax=Arachnia propionica TaxID=1750 RepID=A0A3P1T3F3_9ACTN|nr:M20 family metallopeptidase [Arachnia propionica]MDO5083022.1 M20 family metallopeptidase [Arachnia propionica]RRD03685.1 amidohydrolase [Arachnia propionica]
MSIRDYIAGIEDELVTLRRDLHRIPEVGLHLPDTQARVLAALAGLPLEITLGRQVSSIVAVLRGTAPGDGERPVVLLRGDMDALPVAELTQEPFASTNGNMHACGHDLHMALLVGAVRALCAHRDQLAGDVIFQFQPGEEGVDGCRYMLEEGLLDAAGRRPDAAWAIHVWSAMDPCGVFSTKLGTVMASSDEFRVKVLGRGGHGSAPHRAADPVAPMAQMITATHELVTRRFDIFDPVVVTVGHVRAGTAHNVIPEYAEFHGTFRAFSDEARNRVAELLPALFTGIAEAHGVDVTFERVEQYPVTVNDEAATREVAAVVAELFGEQRHVRWEHPLSAAEDFSRILQAAPGSFIGLSACPPELDPASAPMNHSAHARFDDRVVADGATLLAELAARRLAPVAE